VTGEELKWTHEAKCRGSLPGLFYPEKEKGRDTTSEVQRAKAVCFGRDGSPPCPVRLNCLAYAIETHEKFGVWGGRSERERSRIRRMQRKVTGVGRVVRTVKASPLQRLVDTAKTETRILGAIQRHLMIRPPEPRAQDVIHPSEMCKSDWCPRRTFFRLVEAPAAEAEPNLFTLENVFAEGHDIHHKWQGWLWEMGVLRGRFKCHACVTEFDAISPKNCPLCHAGRACLEYREVELHSEQYLIGGHADGDIADDDREELCALLEVKSIGVGTLRYDAPKLLAAHTRKVKDDDGAERTMVDFDGIWRDIKRPFPSHMRQGMLYLAISGRKVIVFVYECKWNQQVKEFRVRYQPELVADLLDACLDIKYALQSGKPPRRPDWAEASDSPGCTRCIYSETCWDPYLNGAQDEVEQHRSRAGRESGAGEGESRKRRVPVTAASGLRHSQAAS
jgi:Transcription factor WhiB